MKATLKVTLMFVLFVSTTLADGNMGSGGYQGCTPETCPPCTVDCPPPCTESCGQPEGQVDETFATGESIEQSSVYSGVVSCIVGLYYNNF